VRGRFTHAGAVAAVVAAAAAALLLGRCWACTLLEAFKACMLYVTMRVKDKQLLCWLKARTTEPTPPTPEAVSMGEWMGRSLR
jgi:hypothetical protein